MACLRCTRSQPASPVNAVPTAAAAVRNLSTDQLGALSTDQIGALSTDQIVALTTAQTASLTSAQVAGLSSDQLATLATDDPCRPLSSMFDTVAQCRAVEALRNSAELRSQGVRVVGVCNGGECEL